MPPPGPPPGWHQARRRPLPPWEGPGNPPAARPPAAGHRASVPVGQGGPDPAAQALGQLGGARRDHRPGPVPCRPGRGPVHPRPPSPSPCSRHVPALPVQPARLHPPGPARTARPRPRNAAAKSRISILETLSVALPVLTRDLAGAPGRDVLRHALRRELNQNDHARPPGQDELAACLDGSPAAPDYFARRRRVMHRVLAYAVRKKRLEKNPLSKGNLPEGWTPPGKPEEAIDPRSVGSPGLVAGGGTRGAGHSVEVLMRVYARCVAGLEDVWITRMDAALPPADGHGGDGEGTPGGRT